MEYNWTTWDRAGIINDVYVVYSWSESQVCNPRFEHQDAPSNRAVDAIHSWLISFTNIH